MRSRGFRVAGALLALMAAGGATAQQASSADSVVTLAEVVRRALAQYPAVSVARAGLERAQSAAGEARSTRLPYAAVDASMTRFQEPMVVGPIHGFTPGQLPDFDRTLVQGGLTLGYTLWDGGARGARIRRATALEGAAAAGVEGAEQEVVAQATMAYLRVLTLREVLEAHDLRRRSLEAERHRTEQLLTEGRAARVQLLRAEAALSAARAEREATSAQLELARRDLARLAGLPPASLAPARLEAVTVGDTVSVDPSLLLERASAASPAVAGARQMLVAARTSTREVKARFFPTLELAARQAEYGSGSFDFTGEWNAAVRLSYPLWAGGVRFRSLDRVAAEERVAEQELRLAELGAARQVDAALMALTSARARVDALEAAVEQSSEVVRIERLALEAGAGVQTDYLAAEAQLLQARAGLAEARHAAVGARVELARATGELSMGWIQANVESRP